jgi:hypothetical protein
LVRKHVPQEVPPAKFVRDLTATLSQTVNRHGAWGDGHAVGTFKHLSVKLRGKAAGSSQVLTPWAAMTNGRKSSIRVMTVDMSDI